MGTGFWSDQDWLSLKPGKEPIQPFDKSRVEGANYQLSLGDEIYVSEPSGEKAAVTRRLNDDEDFCIAPGQFAFLLTAETVSLPNTVLGFISIRARKKFLGLVNISGFHVDPGYTGKLIFSVFNAGPAFIHIKRGERLFPIWLADLKQAAVEKPTEGYKNIPPELLTPIAGNFTTAYQVDKEVRGQAKRLDQIDRTLTEINTSISELKSRYLIWAAIFALLWLFFGPYLNGQIKTVLSGFSTSSSISAPSSDPQSPPAPPPVVPSEPLKPPSTPIQ
jgi:dCTP deaminase